MPASPPVLAGLVTLFLVIAAMAIPLLTLWLHHRGSQPLPPQLERLGFVSKLLPIVGEAPADLLRDLTL